MKIFKLSGFSKIISYYRYVPLIYVSWRMVYFGVTQIY